MKKLATITGLEIKTLENEKTGELVDFTVIKYLTSGEETETKISCDERTNWVKGNHIEKLKKYLHKPIHELIYRTEATNNGDKYHLDKFADVELRNNK